MPIDSIGPRQPGMIPEPEHEKPDLSIGKGVQGAQGPQAAGEAAAEAGPSQAARSGEGAAVPKFWEPAGERLGESQLQGLLVRDHLQLSDENVALVQQKLPDAGGEAGVWEAKLQGQGSQKHKVAAELQAQGKLQFADEKVMTTGQKLHGDVEKKWDKDLQVQERLTHTGERASQNSEKLAGKSTWKMGQEVLVRDKVKLANEDAITLSRGTGQVSGSEAGVWEAKLAGEKRSAAGIDDVKGHKAATMIIDGIKGHKAAAMEIDGIKGHKTAAVHKEPILIESNAPGVQLDKDHKAFNVAENLGMAQSQNIWGERSASLDGAVKGIIIDNKPDTAGSAIIDDNSLGATGKGIIQDGEQIKHK